MCSSTSTRPSPHIVLEIPFHNAAHAPSGGPVGSDFAASLGLQSRRWWLSDIPFRHAIARNVFSELRYRELARAFEELLSLGKFEGSVRGRFSRSIPGYDAYAV